MKLMRDGVEFMLPRDCEQLRNRHDCFFFDLPSFKRLLREEIRGPSLAYSRLETAAVKLSRRLSRSLEKPTDTFSVHPATLLFPVFIELCSVLPIKALLKSTVIPSATKIVVIPITETKIDVGTVWIGENSLFEIYLAYELSKKFRVIFSIEDNDFKGSINFYLFPNLINIFFQYRGGKLLTGKHAYRQNIIFKNIFGDDSNNKPLVFSMDDSGLPDSVPKLVRFDISLSTSLAETQTANSFQFKLLFDCVMLALSERLRALRRFWLAFIADNHVRELHISDHVCFETGALLSSLNVKSTDVICWPHVSGMSDRWLDIFKEDEVKLFHRGHIEAGTDFKWASRSVIKSELCFDRPPFQENFNPLESINVVIIGTARRLRDFSLLDEKAHIQCYLEILSQLKNINFNLNVFFRPKKHWETLKWFREVTGFDIPEAPFSPSTHSLPNSIFICVSLYGTALFEGITRSAHSILVQSGVYHNYTNKNAEKCIPVLPASGIHDYINMFRDVDALAKAWRRQKNEFIASTSFT